MKLEIVAKKIRRKVIELCHDAKTMHLGSSLSCIDIMVALYWKILNIDPENPFDPIRDRFILSKGHAAISLYTILAHKKFFPIDQLESYAKDGSCITEHPNIRCVPGIEASTGSLGHGLALGLGMVLAGYIQKKPYNVFVLMSDGECNEGSVWETAMLAPVCLRNFRGRIEGGGGFVAIIDYNKWQATGRSNEITELSPLGLKWKAFGWDVYEIDGHNFDDLIKVLSISGSVMPVAIIAHTIKGKGVSFMEDNNDWHYRIPNDDELEKAFGELSD